MKLALLLSTWMMNVAISLPSASASASAAYSSSTFTSTSIQVMATPTAGLIQWTCFAANQISKEDCCRQISEAYLNWHTNEKSQAVDDNKGIDCLVLLAPVPTELLLLEEKEMDDDSLVSHLAQYSLFTETPESVPPSPPSQLQLELQLLWNASNRTRQEIVSSPLLLHPGEQAATMKNLPLIKASVRSSLDDSGGMHRDFHHAIHIQVDRGLRHWKATFYMALYVPQHFFVDVDDALGQLECGDAISCHAEFMHAHVIDIEQPAFASPQHVTWIQLDVASQHQHQAHLQLTSKFHIRYPFPLQVVGDVWSTVELPLPQLIFGIYQLDGEDKNRTWHGGHMPRQGQESLALAIPVRVAAGNHHDYPWVAGMTVVCCLLGVATMLYDIVQVSQWD
jgi:hypothetical protein